MDEVKWAQKLNAYLQNGEKFYVLEELYRNFRLGRSVVPAVIKIGVSGEEKFSLACFLGPAEPLQVMSQDILFGTDSEQRVSQFERTIKEFYKPQTAIVHPTSCRDMILQFEKALMDAALEVNDGKVKAASDDLRMKRSSLQYRIQKIRDYTFEDDFNPYFTDTKRLFTSESYKKQRQNFERDLLLEAFIRAGRNQTLAAELLQMPRSVFQDRAKKRGINISSRLQKT